MPSRIFRRRTPAPLAPARPAAHGVVEDHAIIERAQPCTMTSPERIQALIDAVRYCVAGGIGGAFVECGVWRGGSALAILLTLAEAGVDDRDVHLFDTFTGMTEPTERDVSLNAESALATWEEAVARGDRAWSEIYGEGVYGEDAVRETLVAGGYPAARIHLTAGPVEETIPGAAPAEIALLRLDTDWYESTRHELEHLYPRLASGGVLIIDDYGHWDGARRAVDEYFRNAGEAVLLHRIDYTARIAVKR